MVMLTMRGVWFRDALVLQSLCTKLMTDAEKLDASEIKPIELHADDDADDDDDDNDEPHNDNA